MRVAIINYGAGNLGSVRRAFDDIGADAFVADHPSEINDADRVVLPGVGAFTESMDRLRSAGWESVLNEAVLRQHKPMLGICLGMQLLATTGHEGGPTPGLGFVPGEVERLDVLGCELRVPHVGWNEVTFAAPHQLFRGIPDASDFYFVHSYALVPADRAHAIASTPYGTNLVAAVQHGNVFGCQFHPEKSSKAGRQLLRNFLEYAAC